MRFSYNWLKEYVDIKLSVEELADKLTLAGHEVEEIIYVSQQLEGIITGRVDKITPHPDADKLVITEVYDGKKNHQIVTGAQNIFEGAIIPVSLPGAVLANGMKIKDAKLRGVPSFGMMCSEVELGIAEEAAGVWILPKDTPLGIDFVEYAKIKDALLDISILPNRGDCQSIFGMARDISAILDKPLLAPKTTIKESDAKSTPLKIDVQNPELCPLYTGRSIIDLKHNETPIWMQRCLRVSGIRPLGLLIDITNYVLLEMGQPLHAFDQEKIEGGKIIVRTAKNNETFVTLDGEKKTLTKENLLICDGKKPVALGGVMGGQNSEISATTQTIFLEAAYFHPANIRRTAVKLDCRTESVVRFEKSVDIDGVEFASNRAAYLYQSLADGNVLKGLSKAENLKYPAFKQSVITFKMKDIYDLLGLTKDNSKHDIQVLNKLGFNCKQTKDKLEAAIPSWRRFDVKEMPCLAEEIARMISLDAIPSTIPSGAVVMAADSKQDQLFNTIETRLISQGFYQTNTFTLVAPEDFSNFGLEPLEELTLENPLSVDESIMRESLIPSLLKAMAHNLNRQMGSVKLFEIGKAFEPNKQEAYHLCALASGPLIERAYTDQEKNLKTTLYSLKGLLASFVEQPLDYEESEYSNLHPTQQMNVVAGDSHVGFIGALHPELLKKYDIDKDVYMIYLNVSVLLNVSLPEKQFKAYSKFPSTRRDIALLAPKTLTYSEIHEVMSKYKPKHTKEFFLFDCFESDKIGKDNRSLAFGFIYQHIDRTLSDDEVNKAHEKFTKFLTQQLPITLR